MQVRSALERFWVYLDQPIFFWSRLAVVLACVPLVLSFTQPLWRISMEAPQYPQGLSLDIWPHKLDGGHDGKDLKEINTLNHYIGMRPIDEHEFAELGFMPFAFGVLVILALRVAAIGNVRALIDLTVITLYTLGFFGVRFAYRLYVFGHQLDPAAPFKVEPFTPAIIGTKQIANFTTHSLPLAGTYLVSAFALTLLALTVTQLAHGYLASRREHARRSSLAPSQA